MTLWGPWINRARAFLEIRTFVSNLDPPSRDCAAARADEELAAYAFIRRGWRMMW
jgi:hypothetical protein